MKEMGFLNKNIFSLEPSIFGLDLSDLSVKVLQLEKEGNMIKLVSYSSESIEAGSIEDGKIINKDKVVLAIKKALAKAGPKKIKTNKVVCSLPESKAFLRIITIPLMEEKEAREAIKWEMEANIPLPIDQVYFDWQFLDEAKGKQSVLTVAVSKEVVDVLMGVLEKAGLDVYGLELESIASARSLIRETEKKENSAQLIVDLGAQRTSLIVVVNGIVYFTSSIPFSSESLTESISKKMNLNKKEAEETKINHGIEYLDSENPIFSAAESLVENLVVEIERTLDFYVESSKTQSDIEKIILCGGGANLKGIVPYLTKRLNREIAIGDPWINVNFGKNLPAINKESSAHYSTAIGLAMGSLNYES